MPELDLSPKNTDLLERHQYVSKKDARDHLGKVIQDASLGAPILVVERDEPIAAVVSITHLRALNAIEDGTWASNIAKYSNKDLSKPGALIKAMAGTL